MTHRADCTLTKAGHAAVEEISNIVWDEARTMASGGANQTALDQVREDAIDMAERKYGLQFLDSGAGRLVFQATDPDENVVEEEGNCVVKIAYWNARYHDLGQRQNRAEIEVWNATAPVERDLFVPVKDWDRSDYLWLTMSRVRTERTTAADVATAREQAEKYGWECTDLNPENIGIVHGDVRILDYAHCHLE